jgi:hypothetical protein
MFALVLAQAAAEVAKDSGLGVAEIIAILGSITTIVTTILAIIKHIKAKNYKGAVDEGSKLLQTVASTIDEIKNKTTGDGRGVVKTALKNAGGVLDSMGLKSKMDAKLKELGLDDKS